jgi:hypothetical protein
MSNYVSIRLRLDQRDILVKCLEHLTKQQCNRMGKGSYGIDDLSTSVAHQQIYDILCVLKATRKGAVSDMVQP